MVKASTMAAAGLIGPGTRSTTVQFGDVGYGVGVKVHRFRKCGGWWALFICPRCGGGAQRLRLLDDWPACGACVRASGLKYRSRSTPTQKRHLVTAPPRIARLASDKPLRVHARPGRTLRRAREHGACAQAFAHCRSSGSNCAVREGSGRDMSASNFHAVPKVPDSVAASWTLTLSSRF